MNEIVEKAAPALWAQHKWRFLTLTSCLLGWIFWPAQFAATLSFVAKNMLETSPLIVPGILISAWVNASGAGGRIKQAFEGNKLKAVWIASMVGAITPVCGVTVLPLMASLLASGVPLAPVMAFWLSSPVTDPTMFAVTAATLGFHFAIAKTLAAFGIGVFGGVVTIALSARPWTLSPLRQNGLAAVLSCQSVCTTARIEFAIWRNRERRLRFMSELWAMTKLLVICLGLAFAAEYWLQALLRPDALANYVGVESGWAIPLAVFIGAPAYLDGYAALPLTRGLIEHGMSLGAAMALLVSGSVVSIWGAIAIFPVLKLKPFLLYLTLAVIGSLSVGALYEIVT